MTLVISWYESSTASLGNLFQCLIILTVIFFPCTQSDVGERAKTAYRNLTPKLDDAEQSLLSNFYMLQDGTVASEAPLDSHCHASCHTAGIIPLSVQHNSRR